MIWFYLTRLLCDSLQCGFDVVSSDSPEKMSPPVDLALSSKLKTGYLRQLSLEVEVRELC